ncbi:serine protease [Halobacteriales archaeon QS_1_68_17]|nr:MAG: serine protease [Halobacteriales archaeon QS_1_68_17]
MERDLLTRRRLLATIGTTVAAAGCSGPPQAAEAPAAETATPVPDPGDGSYRELAADSQADGSVYTRVYRNVIESVVLVRVSASGDGPGGQGTGFVFDDRHVVTNEHVVGQADRVNVRFQRGGWRPATVAGTDVYSDLAALRIENVPDSATPLSLVEDPVVVGQQVLAIGNPFGLSGSASAGIVSGVDRTLPAANGFSIPDAIQTDAAVNPGNSGGPLVTLDSEVAGVINSGGGDNIGFAISAALVRRVVPQLIENGDYDHSYMGVLLAELMPAVARANNLDAARGVYVDEVRDGGPSDGVLQGSTGQRRVDGSQVPVGGDVIVEMGDTATPTRQALSSFLALQTSPGDTVPVTVVRDGSRTTVDLTLGSRPEP